MPIFAIKSQSGTVTLADPAGDYRAAKKLEQYRLSGEAIYYPGFPGTWYLPFQAVTKAVCRNTGLPVSGCCGKELPVTKVRLYYDEESWQDFTFEKEGNARKLLEALGEGTEVDAR